MTWLDEYFARVQFGGATTANLETLRALLGAHMARIPFENLDVLLGRPIRLDLDGLVEKLVRRRRGGYCFEQATLFCAVLGELGFRPVRHSARVIAMTPRESAARTHMFVTVPLAEGTFVVDPGFGSLAPRVPVPLDGTETKIGHETHVIVRDGERHVLRAIMPERVVDAWVTTLEEDFPIDFELANYWISTNPASPFVKNIMMRALTPDGRVGVMNRDVTIRRGEEMTKLQLADRTGLRALFAEYFGVDVPEIQGLKVPSIPEWP